MAALWTFMVLFWGRRTDWRHSVPIVVLNNMVLRAYMLLDHVWMLQTCAIFDGSTVEDA